ncbi:MAG: hypothetical protein HY394_01560 [Candidatus Diapherotrites archaeon]|nr:hypothetical protein [Candidatus Diapherotrites archaeon]
MAPRLGEKGQASLTDSMFFLIIVSALSVFLFSFSVSYGMGVSQQLVREYRSEFAASAMKSILYSSVPRQASDRLENASEVDYLLAAIKEDYADDQLLDLTRETIARRVVSVMEPLSDSFDYVFFIYLPSTTSPSGRFPFVLFYHNDFSFPAGRRSTDAGNPIVVSSGRAYFCDPVSKDVITNRLLPAVGDVAFASNRLELFSNNAAGPNQKVLAEIGLAMWPTTVLPESVWDPANNPGNLNCDLAAPMEVRTG